MNCRLFKNIILIAEVVQHEVVWGDSHIQWTWKDWGGFCCGLFESTTLAFTWRDWGNPQKTPVKILCVLAKICIGHSPTSAQLHYHLNYVLQCTSRLGTHKRIRMVERIQSHYEYSGKGKHFNVLLEIWTPAMHSIACYFTDWAITTVLLLLLHYF
jgi:hypothetical protein